MSLSSARSFYPCSLRHTLAENIARTDAKPNEELLLKSVTKLNVRVSKKKRHTHISVENQHF